MITQTYIETLLHPKHIQKDLKQIITNELTESITKAKQQIHSWINTPTTRQKRERRSILQTLDLQDLITDLISHNILHTQTPLPLTTLSSMYHIPPLNRLDSMKTTMELIALLEPLEIYTIDNNRNIESLLNLPERIRNRHLLTCYLPPMIEKPNHLTHNTSSPLKTIHTGSLILGDKENHHEMNICLDVINTQNKNQYELDKDFINHFEKQWTREILTKEQLDQLTQQEREQYELELSTFLDYKEQFNVLTEKLLDKTIYLCNKVDKRGRLYTQGYHFNTQGTSYEKACINLKTKETVTGEL